MAGIVGGEPPGTMHDRSDRRRYGSAMTPASATTTEVFIHDPQGGHMVTTPDTVQNDAVIREALSVIDKALGQMMSRELVSSGEVTDVLLDVRTLLAHSAQRD
jgi:hypothetical protein